ncbi:MAG: protein kinase [Pseudomonadota bacterium]
MAPSLRSSTSSSKGRARNATEAPFLLPESMVDHFQVVRLIGRGGMGEVYLARDTLLNRRVALKLVHPRYLDSEEAIARFMREAQVTASLSHPHIVTVYAVGRCEGRPYLALEYLEGQNLRQRIDEERPGVRESLRIVLAISQALVEAHRHRVLHRDLKPENVILAKDGRLRLVDLGLAKVASSAAASSSSALMPVERGEEHVAPKEERIGQRATGDGLLRTEADLGQSAETVVDLDAQRKKADARAGSQRQAPRIEGEAQAGIPSPGQRQQWQAQEAEVPVPGDAGSRGSAGLQGDAGSQASAGSPGIVESGRSAEPPARVEERAAAGQAAPCCYHATTAGTVQGTPAYMAPEQWRGDECGAPTDIWALGVLLHELLAGRRPYEDTKGESLRDAVVRAEAAPSLAPNQAVSVALVELVGRCLEKDASRRPSAPQMVDVLERLLSEGRHHVGAEQSPFRGLFSFAERHAELFFGRDSEIAVFLESLRGQAVVPVVGPSGAGKSSFVQAGVIPRLREQGAWMALTIRPGENPFAALASRLSFGENSLRRSEYVGSVFRTSDLSNPLTPELATGIAGSPGDGFVTTSDEETLAKHLCQRPETLGLILHDLAARERCKVLLFVDQLEEVYTLLDDSAVQEAFVRAICGVADHPSSPVRAVFTIRDDFLGYLEGGSEVAAALSRVFVLRRPGKEGLEEVLSRPLTAVGYSYDDPLLVAEMVESVKNEPACLPLIQFAGQMLWDRRDKERRLLCRATYEAMGGVAGSLAEHADGVLAGMTPLQVELTRQVLLRLVTSAGTRRVVPVPAAVAGLGPGVEEVLDRLTQARLLTVRRAAEGRRRRRDGRAVCRSKGDASGSGGGGGSGGGDGSGAEAVLELVHESLVRTWGRLARWLEESREDVAFVAEATQAAELWEKRGEREEEVWQGDALRDARSKAARLGATVPELVVRFLEAATRKEQRAYRRRKSMLSLAIAALALVAVAAVLVAQLTVTQRKRAEKERAEAQAQRAEAQREGASAAMRRGDLLEARAKLRGSLETCDSTVGRVLWGELQQEPLRWSKTLGGQVNDTAFSPDGRIVAGACADGRIYLVDLETTAVRVLRGHGSGFTAVAFSPDGKHLAAGSETGLIVLWDMQSGSARELAGHRTWVFGLTFDVTGELLASASTDTTVRAWRVGNEGEGPLVLRGHEKRATRIVFTATGSLLSASVDGTVRQWALENQGSGRVLIKGFRPAYGLDLAPASGLLVSGGGDGTVRLFDADTGAELTALRGHQDVVTATVFSPDGKTVASSSTDKSVRLWDMASRKGIVLGRHLDIVTAVAFNPDGRMVASSGRDGTLRLWRAGLPVDGGAEESGHVGAVQSLDMALDGVSLASGADDMTVRVWDAISGRQRLLLAGHRGAVAGLTFCPADGNVVSSSYDRGVRIWDGATGNSDELMPRHEANALDIACSSDGRLLVSVDVSGFVHRWDPRARSLIWRRRVESPVLSVAVSSDGILVGAAAENGSAYVLDGASSELRAELRGHRGEVAGIVFGTDGRVITGGHDGTVRSWDLSSKAGTVLGNVGARVTRLAISLDGRLLGVSLDDGTVRLWDLATGRTNAVLRGHRSGVVAARFAPDGRLAATAGVDGTVRTWTTASGRPYWRAPLLLRSPPRIFSHLGWARLDGERDSAGRELEEQDSGRVEAGVAGASWRRAVEEQAKVAVQTAVGKAPGYGGDSLCLLTYDDDLQLWSMTADRLLASVPVGNAIGGAGQTTDEATGSRDRAQSTPGMHESSRSDAGSALETAPPDNAKKRGPDSTTGTTHGAYGQSGFPQLAATNQGCLVLSHGRVLLLEVREGGRDANLGGHVVRVLADQASAIAFQSGRILIAAEQQALVLDENGNELARTRVEQGVSTLGSIDDGRLLVVGYDAGDIELLRVDAGSSKPSFSFEETMAASVERIDEGPRRTLIVGYASGDLGIWSLETGKRLRHFKLHGPIAHVLVDSETRHLYVATEVGDYRAIDLAALFQDYCELLDDIWDNVPVAWQAGMPASALPPSLHRCRGKDAH